MIMKFKAGQLAWIISSCSDELISPPVLILSSYPGSPKIFINDPIKNEKWLEYEDIGSGWVYDIMYAGNIEVSVSEEWLTHFDIDCE